MILGIVFFYLDFRVYGVAHVLIEGFEHPVDEIHLILEAVHFVVKLQCVLQALHLGLELGIDEMRVDV